MVEFDRTLERDQAAAPPVKICVAGVGSGGLNVLDRISLDRMMEASLVSMHTDVRVLGHTMSTTKIQLGADIMRGIGSGGDPELGREAAQSSREHIKAALRGHDMIFICCGLGGGTGSGATPVVAEIAKELGAMVFVFATMPFSFEGRRRLTQAEVALEELQGIADALILFENNRMGELILPKEGIQKAFSQADQLIGHSVRAISTMVTQPGIVRMGLADLMTALNNPNARCLFGFGEARGSSRVADALKRALKSPLVNQGLLLQNARNLLVHVAGGESLSLAEVESLMKQLGKHVPENTQIMFGLAVDPRMGDSLSVTLISSLTAQDMAVGSVAVPHPATITIKPQLTPVARFVETPPEATAPLQIKLRPVVTEPLKKGAVFDELFPIEQAEVPEPEAELFAVVEEPVTTESRPLFVKEVKAAIASPAVIVEPEAMVEEVVSEIEPVGDPAPQPEPERVVEPPAALEVVKAAVEEEVIDKQPEQAPPVTLTSRGFASTFTVIESDDDDEVEDEASSSVNEGHWAEKYMPSKPLQPHAPSVSPRREPVSQPEPAMAHAVAKPLADFQQASFNLNQEEITRFKGTDKNIVEGEDLDVPTWMRLRQKLKR
jgi:cell division protein FtsZ